MKLVNTKVDWMQVFVIIKKTWNKDKFRYECKKLIGKRICDKEFIWNPSHCDFECEKSCDLEEYLDYKNCKCRGKIVDRLVEECSEMIDGNEMIYNGTVNDYKKCVILYNIHCIICHIFSISIRISSAFVFFFVY